MKILQLVGLLVCGFFGGSTLGATSEKLKAKAGKPVDVLAEPNKSAQVIASLKAGETLDAVKRSGMYWEVKTKDGKSGYVSFVAVERELGAATALTKAILDSAKESRDSDDVKATRSRSAVMGIRGLDENSGTSNAGNVTPNFRMVYNMEDRVISPDKLKSFEQAIIRSSRSEVR